MQITSSGQQSIIDLAIAYTGSIEGVFDILEANPSLTHVEANVQKDQVIEIPNVIYNKQVVQFFKNNTQPATAGFLEGYGPPIGGDFDLNDFNNDFG